MALYTYSDFENAAKSLGHFDTLSKADINLAKSNPDAGMSLLKYVNDYSLETNTSKRKSIENSINTLRQTYGGYKIVNGQLQLTSPTATNFNYVSPYADRISALTNAIAQRQPFSFDTEKDPSAQAAKKSYLRESRRATEDAIATASAMTGGIPSSYAVAAGTQAGDYHASQFADKVQALENAAYNKYLNEHSLKQNELDSLIQREANEKNAAYTEHMNRVNTGGGNNYYSNNNYASYGSSSSSGNKGNSSIFEVLPVPETPPAETLPPETEPQGGLSAGNSSGSGDITSQLPEPDDTKPVETVIPEIVETNTSDGDLVTQAGGFGDAYSQLVSLGYSPISKATFDRMKQQGQASGSIQVAGVAKYDTYDDYLNYLLDYALK